MIIIMTEEETDLAQIVVIQGHLRFRVDVF